MAECSTVDDAMEVDVQQTPSEAVVEGSEALALVNSMNIRPEDIMESIANTASYYCAKGFNAFDDTMLTTMALDGAKARAGLQASVQVYAKVLGQMQHQMTLFKRDALATTLSIPPQLLAPQPPQQEDMEVFTEEQEQKCDQQLSSLMERLVQVRANKRQLEKETALLRSEIAAYGDPAPLAAVTQPVSGGKENLAEDAAAIVAQARKLGPLLQRAEQVLVHHQEAKAGRQVQSVTSLAEKEIAARRTKAQGYLTSDLVQARQHFALQ